MNHTTDQKNQDKGTSSYHIKIRGHLAPHWSDWFGGLELRHDDDGNTLLTGDQLDQSAVHAVLRQIRDAGMILHSVTYVDNN